MVRNKKKKVFTHLMWNYKIKYLTVYIKLISSEPGTHKVNASELESQMRLIQLDMSSRTIKE